MADTDNNGHITESGFPGDNELDHLYKAAGNIRKVFAPLSGTSPSKEVLIQAELSVRDDIKTIYINLFAMVVAELEVRSRSSRWFFLSSVSYEFEEIAHVTAETPYSKRSRDDFLEITDLILRFFSGDGEKGKKDLFYYLRGVTEKNLSQILKKISRSEKKLLHYVFTAVTRHIASSPRYRRSASIVTDLEALGPATLRQATIFEIVGACASLLQGTEKPARLVDMIFDELLVRKEFACHLHISTLRIAVFDLIKSRFISPPKEATHIDPMQEYLQMELLGLADESLRETSGAYGWRRGGSAENREAYLKAGRDILEEIIVHGTKIPHHEALGRHIPDCDETVYETTHKGSFQNFWKVLWDNFLKKIRADI